MNKTYKVVIIGFGHMHINDVGAHFKENLRTDIVACADTKPLVEELKAGSYTRKWNLEFAKKNFGIKKVYDNYKEMLDSEKPDLAVVTSENIMHAEIVEECAKRGISACIEKPMAVSLSAGMHMIRSAKTYGSLLMVNWPITWVPEIQFMKKLVDGGKIGRIIEFKLRLSSTGPLGQGAKHKGASEIAGDLTDIEKARTWWHQALSGGGAMLDYCGYGCLLSNWFMGKTGIAAMGMSGNFNSQWGDAEDNAAMLVRYSDAFANIESSWTTYKDIYPVDKPVIYGTKGIILSEEVDGKGVVKIIGPSGSIEILAPEELGYKLNDISCAYVHHMDTGEPLHETLQPEFNIDALAVLDAGIRSSQSGKLELVNNWTWQI